jgi:hypothetical protein
MNSRFIALLAIGMLAIGGCDEIPQTAHNSVLTGMSRDDLRMRFGEPLRIEPVASGGEDWYYRFVLWTTNPTGSSGVTEVGNERLSYASVGLETSRDSGEKPVHISAEGFVIEPVPYGKVAER